MYSEAAISVENLSKCYPVYSQPRDRLKQFILPRFQRTMGLSEKQYFSEFWALRDVSFEIEKGETVGIIGRNGSGKSTLLQMICGTLNSTNGSINTKGRISALLELGSGFNPEFTGRENVYLNGAILGLSKDEIDAKYADIVAFADIGQFIDRSVKIYSSGMLIRLAFSVAINIEPDILIVDEALAVGDELFRRKCFSRIESIRSNGATILFVSHSGAQIVEICDRAILLDGGEKVAIGSPKKVVGLYQKLLYAPRHMQRQIREECLGLNGHDDIVENPTDTFPTLGDQQKEYFDPNLIPSNTIEFESHGPIIDQPVILTMSGKKVNNLLRDERYKYCYKVNFKRCAANVRFGMSVKTTTGVVLAGAFSTPSRSDSIPLVAEGSVIDVEFKFSCYLNPGLYFLNAGVFGDENGEAGVLHRRVDVAVFRVLPISRKYDTESVSLQFEPKIIVHEKSF